MLPLTPERRKHAETLLHNANYLGSTAATVKFLNEVMGTRPQTKLRRLLEIEDYIRNLHVRIENPDTSMMDELNPTLVGERCNPSP